MKQKPYNVGRNAAKQIRKAAFATAKGAPGGWKKAVRTLGIMIKAAKKAAA